MFQTAKTCLSPYFILCLLGLSLQNWTPKEFRPEIPKQICFLSFKASGVISLPPSSFFLKKYPSGNKAYRLVLLISDTCIVSHQSKISSILPVDPFTKRAATSGMKATAAFSVVLWIELAAPRLGPATEKTSWETSSLRSPIQPLTPLSVRVPRPHRSCLSATIFCVFWPCWVLRRNRHVLTRYINRLGRRCPRRCCCPRPVLWLALAHSAFRKLTKLFTKRKRAVRKSVSLVVHPLAHWWPEGGIDNRETWLDNDPNDGQIRAAFERLAVRATPSQHFMVGIYEINYKHVLYIPPGCCPTRQSWILGGNLQFVGGRQWRMWRDKGFYL